MTWVTTPLTARSSKSIDLTSRLGSLSAHSFVYNVQLLPPAGDVSSVLLWPFSLTVTVAFLITSVISSDFLSIDRLGGSQLVSGHTRLPSC